MGWEGQDRTKTSQKRGLLREFQTSFLSQNVAFCFQQLGLGLHGASSGTSQDPGFRPQITRFRSSSNGSNVSNSCQKSGTCKVPGFVCLVLAGTQ